MLSSVACCPSLLLPLSLSGPVVVRRPWLLELKGPWACMAFQLLVILDSDLRKPKAICEDGARARTNFEGNNDAEWAGGQGLHSNGRHGGTPLDPLRCVPPIFGRMYCFAAAKANLVCWLMLKKHQFPRERMHSYLQLGVCCRTRRVLQLSPSRCD